MRKNLLLIFLLPICIFLNSAYAGQTMTDMTLQVEGSAPVVKDDVARARKEAVKNALQEAIMQVAAKILVDKFDDENFQAVKSVMVGKVDRYIKYYRIISGNRQQDEYTANVHVVVLLAPVRDDLLKMGILPDQEEKEGILVNLSLKGMKKYSDFNNLKVFLQNRPKIVKSVYPCRLEWQQAYCNLVLIGDVRNLVAELEMSGKYTTEIINDNQDIVEIILNVKEEVR